MNFQPDAVVLNGQTSYRGFNIDGLFHPVKPIEQLITLTFKDMDNAYLYSFNLQNHVDCDLKVIGTYGVSNRENLRDAQGKLFFYKNNKIEEFITFQTDNYITKSLFILKKNETYKIGTGKTLNKLVFYCEPIFVLSSLQFSNLPSEQINVDP